MKAFTAEDNKSVAKEKIEDIYTFRVELKYSPGIWRKMKSRAEKSLHRLHQAIVEAFEREDEDLYAFFMNNKAWDISAEYGPHMEKRMPEIV